jgi:class 3 adenylate cyclase/tetratricopeptide (TPR) repeat protein
MEVMAVTDLVLRGAATAHLLEPYVPRLVVDWLADDDTRTHRRVAGTLAFVDISGFTALTERLARKGHVGAEEMSDALNATFGHLLTVAHGYGADLVKWGGDAILLMFSGEGHADRGCAAAFGMRATLRDVGRLRTTAGAITLRMSVGVHSGDFDYFLVGDPDLHRELLVTGPAASETARLEGVAVAGQVVISGSTAHLLDASAVGDQVDPNGWLLRRSPDVAPVPALVRQRAAVDVGRVLPVAIRQHLLAGPGTPEHRTIAVAFVQFAGTDALLRDEGPEATAAALDDCIRNVSHAAHAHGVTFFETDINVDGGKIMLTAGAPSTAGHDADRLLRTGRRILDHAGRLPLRIGVNFGHVFSGDFGPRFRRTYSVKGDAINLAARVMGKASAGQLLATRTVFEHAQTQFESTPVGPFTVKGKALPVHAVEVGRITGGREHRVGRENTLVGREAEMEVLTAALDACRAGTGSVVQLLGEPGIGKSRLMEELADDAGSVRVQTIVCDDYLSATPYGAFRDLLRDLFGITERTPVHTALDAITRHATAAAPDTVPWLPLLSDVLDLDIPETPIVAELDDQFRRDRIESLILALLCGILPAPTLINVDDAQHMDPASSELLNHVAAAAIDEQPWLLVVSRRDQPLGWIPDEGLTSTEIRVRPLTVEQSLELAVSAGKTALPRQALAALAQKADGNPFFLESLISQAGPAGTIESLPQSIEEVVAAQIDSLSPTQRSVLRHAAVLGSQFRAAELADLLPDLATTLTSHLEDGLSDFLVAESSTGELRFRHGLIREVAYQGLAYGARRRLHDQVGLALERTHAATDEEVLSFHFLHAGRYDKAWSYARVAGQKAVKMYANVEAAALLGRAVEAARRLPRGTLAEPELGRVLEQLGDCWFTIGLTDAAYDAYRQAHREVRADRFESARIVAKEAMVDQRLRKFPQAMRRLTRELRGLEGLPGAAAHHARSRLQVRYAISRVGQGRMADAIAWGTGAVEEAKLSGDPEALAPAYAMLHGIYLAAGRDDSYRSLGALALEAYVELDDLSGQAKCTNNLAVEALENHRWEEAATMFGRAVDLYRRLGDTDNEGVATCNHAEVLVNQGRCAEALPLLAEALQTAQSVSDDELIGLVGRQLGRARARLGEPAVGLEHLDHARAIFQEIDAPDEVALTDLARVEALLIADDPAAALTVADTLADAEFGDPAALPALRGFGLLALGRTDDAREAFESGLALERPSFGVAASALGLSHLTGSEAHADQAERVLAQLGVVDVPPWGRSIRR